MSVVICEPYNLQIANTHSKSLFVQSKSFCERSSFCVNVDCNTFLVPANFVSEDTWLLKFGKKKYFPRLFT